MFFDILTLFPDMFKGPFSESILARAQKKDILNINIINIRDYALDKHHTTDDYPYGGGAGMVMKVEPVYRALQEIKNNEEKENIPVILFSPQGKRLNQDRVKELSENKGLILLCGHYEGFDERIRQNFVTDEVSIGDFVLTGGELPAMVLVDAVARMIPGVLGDENSKIEDSFYHGLLDYPQYTRPREFMGMKVPEILLNGNHGLISKWRKKEALKRTFLRRPELIEQKSLTSVEKELLNQIETELEGDKNGQN